MRGAAVACVRGVAAAWVLGTGAVSATGARVLDVFAAVVADEDAAVTAAVADGWLRKVVFTWTGVPECAAAVVLLPAA